MKKILFIIFSWLLVVTLVACNEKEGFTVKFDTNGGEPAVIADLVDLEEGSKIEEPSVTKEGYELEHWYVLGDFTIWNFAEDTVTKDITLVANWKETNTNVEDGYVRVTFNVTLPVNTPAGDIYLVGEFNHDDMEDWNPSALSGKATRNNNVATFSLDYKEDDLPVTISYKWTRGSFDNVEKGQNGEEIGNRVVVINGEKTINDTVLNWADLLEEKDEYTVTFDSNGGSAISSELVEQGGKVTVPSNPTKDDHVFYVWELNGVPFDFDQVITGDITLVARWVEVEDVPNVETNTVTTSVTTSAANFNSNETLNQADVLNLNTNIFTVLAKKSEYTGNQAIGLNNGVMRFYSDRAGGNGNELKISVASGYTITKIEIVFLEPAANRIPLTSELTIGTVKENLVTADIVKTTLVRSNLSISEFNFKLNHVSSSDSAQVWIESIKITYETGTSTSSSLSNEQKVTAAKNTLVTNALLGANESNLAVESNLTLPTTFAGVNVSWNSSNAQVISNNGLVRPLLEDEEVTLTATFSLGGVTLTKVFNFTVLAGEETEVPPQGSMGLPEVAGSTNIADFVTKAEGFEARVVGVVTSIAPFNSFSIEDETGAMAFRINNQNATNITFAVGDVIEAVVKKVVYNGLIQGEILAADLTNAEKFKIHKGDFGTLGVVDLNDLGFNHNTLLQYQSRTVSFVGAEVTEKNVSTSGAITLTVKLGNDTIQVRWDQRTTGVDTTVLNKIVVGDFIDVNDATLSWFNVPQVMVGDTQDVTINSDGLFGPDATDQDKLDQSVEMLSMSAILGSNKNALEVTRNLNLINNFEDVLITWSSNSISVISNSGVVTRPMSGDLNVKLTATIKIGTLTASKEFEFIVLEHVESTNPSDEDPAIVSYYNFLSGLSGSAWQSALISKIKTTGTQKGSTGDVKAIDSYGSSYYLIYDGMGAYGNREHTVPASYLRDVGAKEDDLHNLRAAKVSTNSTRSNYPFGSGAGGWKLNNKSNFYPGDEHIGDVARIVLYIATRNNISLTKLGGLNMFLQWHEADPVDDFERLRNDRIYSKQNSRNPFIDYPEFVDMLFGTQTVAYESVLETLISYLNYDLIDLLVLEQDYVDLNRNQYYQI